jgi:serine/threonine protein kinase
MQLTMVSCGPAAARNSSKPYIMMKCLYLVLALFSTAQAFTAVPRRLTTVHSQRITRLFATSTTSTSSVLSIGEEVGRGSYGIVHFCTLGDETLIGKRAYVLDELTENNDSPQNRLKRCKYYWNVERHCFEKMAPHPQIPNYRGIFVDAGGNEWMTFNVISSNNHKVSSTLQQVMDADWKVQHEEQEHHLSKLQEALGLTASDESSFSVTLDCVMESLLKVLTHVHSQASIVHRDVKPGNLLVDPQNHALVLIDFGSAADMDPTKKNFFGGSTRVGLENDNRVAVSPIYSAPELFIQPDRYVRTVILLVLEKVFYSLTIIITTQHRAPFQFDVFSAALIVCQLLFNYLDERTDAGFHQQLEDANCDLDVWLSRELGSKVRPAGLEEALEYLADRPGVWRLLGDMLRRNPEQRVSSQDALQRWQLLQTTTRATDGPFFESVIALMEECEVPPTVQRPLHFVATFRRHVPLGLVLSEIEPSCTDPKWIEATADAEPGEVFVQKIVPDSQADQMGIFEVGDRLQGVGELPLANRGFERVLEMLEQQPKSAKYVKLHFDRQAARRIVSSPSSRTDVGEKDRVKIVAQGAWSSKGRRKAQEDTFGK